MSERVAQAEPASIDPTKPGSPPSGFLAPGGVILLIMAPLAATGWLPHLPKLALLTGYSGAMPYPTALGFILTGLALLSFATGSLPARHVTASFPSALADVRKLTGIRSLLGLSLILLGIAALIEWHSGLRLGLPAAPGIPQSWHADGNPAIAPMLPIVALCFMATGSVLLILALGRKPWLDNVAHGFVLLVLLTGSLGTVGGLPGYDQALWWFSGPGFYAGLGFLISGTGLLLLLRQVVLVQPLHNEEDRRISRTANVVAILIGLGGMIAGFALLSSMATSGLDSKLAMSLAERSHRLEDSILKAWMTNEAFASREASFCARERPSAQDKTDRATPFSAILFSGKDGRELIRTGRFVAVPEGSARLDTPTPSALLWHDGGYVLHSETSVVHDGQVVGHMITEQRLAIATEPQTQPDSAQDFSVCGSDGAGRLNCFPAKPSQGPGPFHLVSDKPDRRSPMALAAEGKTGIAHIRNPRGMDVVTAYQPVGSLGLTAGLTVDASDLYAPIGKRFSALLLLLLLIGPASILLLRLQLTPLLRRIVLERDERKQAKAGLEQSRAELMEITNTVGEGLYVQDSDGVVTFANPQAERLLGWPAGELVGRNGHEAFHVHGQDGSIVPVESCAILGTIRLGGTFQSPLDWFKRRDGSIFPVSIVSSPIRRDGRIAGSVTVFRDITLQREAELLQGRLNRSLRLLSECNKALVVSGDEQTLIESICRLIVDTGGYVMAWIGYPEMAEDKRIRPVAQAGDSTGYLRKITLTWSDEALGRGPTGSAIRTGQTQINQSSQDNPGMAPWRNSSLNLGYLANIALPLKNNGLAFGALTIYASSIAPFAPDEVKLLEELAGNLSFGILTARSEIHRRQALEQLRQSEERYRLVLENAADAIFIVDPEGRCRYANRETTSMLGYGNAELLAMSVPDFAPFDENRQALAQFEKLKAEGTLRTEVTLRRRTGKSIPVELHAVKLPDGNLLAACRDIEERKRYESRLEYQATHDALTGLANRSLLADRMNQAIFRAAHTRQTVAFVLLDLDRFKLVNDSLGHTAGDEILIETARRISGELRASDTVARLGGDEFMIVLPDLKDEADATPIAEKLLQALKKPFQLNGHEMVLTCSIGVSIYPKDGTDASSLLKNADVAMYQAKELGRNHIQFYRPEMNTQIVERFEFEKAIRKALENDELELFYQPKVSLVSGRIVGAEALIRWHRPGHGLVQPGEFICLAEETGLIIQLGEWVVEKACEQIKAWHDQGLPFISVAVNMSAQQFQQENLAQVFEQALRINGVSAQHLQVEVTESAIMANPDVAAAMLNKLKKQGLQISLDDFGTGYSSLGYLKHFPIDSLKIDKSFVRDIADDPDDAAIARMIITLAKSMRIQVIAEGVETLSQLKFLQRHRCDMIQGYYFSMPLPAGPFADLVQRGAFLMEVAEQAEELPTLLLVDDEMNVLSALKRLLRTEGYRILTAASAEAGLDLLARHRIHVVVSDQRMPNMSGTEFLHKVSRIYPDTIRILLTGYTDLESVITAVNHGSILKFLTKPWDDDLLREHIREAFRYHEQISVADQPDKVA